MNDATDDAANDATVGGATAIVIRPVEVKDRAQVLTLAPRLVEGIAPWRDADAVLVAARDWLTGSMASAAVDVERAAVFVAVESASGPGSWQGCV